MSPKDQTIWLCFLQILVSIDIVHKQHVLHSPESQTAATLQIAFS